MLSVAVHNIAGEEGSGSVGGEMGGTMMIGQAIGLTPRLPTNPRNSSSNPAKISRVRSGSMWIGMRIVAHVLHTTSIVFDDLCLPLVEITGYCIFEHIGQGSHGMPIATPANA